MLDTKQRPHIVGAAITGFYIVIYIIILDSTAVYYYTEGRDEYSSIDFMEHNFNFTLRNSLQLKLTWATLIMEYFTSNLAFIICIGFIVCKEWCQFRNRSYHTIKDHFLLLRCGLCDVFLSLTIISSLLLIIVAIIYAHVDGMSKSEKSGKNAIILLSSVLFFIILLSYFWLSKGKTIYLVSFMVIPAIFISAHVGYIFAAWLTEPSKTTSVSILALYMVLYLFIISRLAYRKVRSHVFHYTESERVILLITVIIVFFGVSLVALNAAAFYILPIPAIKLADYLENIFEISLLIFAALISYKILIQEDSEAKKFFKKFNKVFKNDTPFKALKVGTQSKQDSNNLGLDEKEARLCGKFVWSKMKISDITLDRRYITCEIEEATLIMQLRGHENNSKKVKIHVQDVNLNLGFVSSETEQVRIPLSEAKLSFEVVSPNGNEKVIVPLTKACSIGNNSVPASEYERHILCKEKEPLVVSLTRAVLSCVNESINICKPNEFEILKVLLKCYITKTKSGRPGEVYCLLDNFVSITGLTGRQAKNLITWNYERIEQQILPYSSVYIETSLCGDDNNFYDLKLMGKREIFQQRCALNMKIELKRQFLELRYSISISDNIKIKHNTTDGVAYLEVVYSEETVLSVPALAKFTTVMLTRSRNNRIRYGNNQIHVFGDYALVKFVPGDGECYEIGSEAIPTASHDIVHPISTRPGTKLVLSQMFGADTTLKVTQENVEVNYKDEGTVKLNIKHDQAYQLELRKIEQDEYPSYLYISNSEPVPTDVFENAGAAFGQIALAMSHDNN